MGTRQNTRTVLDDCDGSVTYPFQRPSKRPRVNTAVCAIQQPTDVNESGNSDTAEPAARDHEFVQFRISDKDGLEKWFGEAFKAVQQVSCRLIAKVWIKKIHPRKQSTNPYNGNHPRDKPRDPERTKPDYWPAGVQHKEPDHIDRSGKPAMCT